jgi:hypothetical protein
MTEIQNRETIKYFDHLEIGILNLFGIWCLRFEVCVKFL